MTTPVLAEHAGACGRASCRAMTFWIRCPACGETWLQECGTCTSVYTDKGIWLAYESTDCGCVDD